MGKVYGGNPPKVIQFVLGLKGTSRQECSQIRPLVCELHTLVTDRHADRQTFKP